MGSSSGGDDGQRPDLDRIVVILVEPQAPGNVGSAARAMKNMGLSRLVVVDPPAYDPQRARWMAPGCSDILRNMRLVATLDEALEGVHVAVAATARHRKLFQAVVEPAAFANAALERDGVTAVLFGREDSGLPKSAVHRCSAILRIPTPEHASLNLAQAVMVTCHNLFEAARRRGAVASGRTVGGRERASTAQLSSPSAEHQLADLPYLEPAVGELLLLLDRVGYTRSAAPEKILMTARTLLQDASLSTREVGALRGMVSRISWALDNPGIDWRATRRDRRPE